MYYGNTLPEIEAAMTQSDKRIATQSRLVCTKIQRTPKP
jgi:hypothetical protein